MSLVEKIKSKYQIVAYDDPFPFIVALKNAGTCDHFFPALDHWLEGNTGPFLTLYDQKKIPVIERPSKTLYRCVMVSPKEYESFMAGDPLKSTEVLQSWSSQEVIGTPFKNKTRPIYLHFKRKFNGTDIVLDMPEDLWAYKQEDEIVFDKYNLIEQESEVICKSVELHKNEMDWEPFIPDCFEENKSITQISKKYNLDISDPHSM